MNKIVSVVRPFVICEFVCAEALWFLMMQGPYPTTPSSRRPFRLEALTPSGSLPMVRSGSYQALPVAPETELLRYSRGAHDWQGQGSPTVHPIRHVQTPSQWPSRAALDWREESLGRCRSVDVLSTTISFTPDGRRPEKSRAVGLVAPYTRSLSSRSSFNLHADDDPPPLSPNGRPTTRAQLLDMRRRQAMEENASWFMSTRSVLPQGRTLGAPGKAHMRRFSHLDDGNGGGLGREKWWGNQPLYKTGS